jgi:DNA-binding NtrC family response regulator
MFMSQTREAALPSRLAMPRPTRPTQPGTTTTATPTPNAGPPASPEGESRIDRLLPIEAAAKPTLSILVIDDERTLRESCAAVLKAEGYQVRVAGRGEEALELVRRHAFDIVLIDLYMSGVSGSDLLQATLGARPDAIAIVITGKPSVESSLAMLRAGAWDYLPKPFTGTQLQILIGRAAHAALVARESRAQAARRIDESSAEKLVVLGSAPSFTQVIALARRVAVTDASVFITGESGSGKELIAQFIHLHSRRSSRPLVAINCAALPEPLLESEMFGHCRGAFTGAIRDKPGLLEAANGGTLFLDELVEMSKPIQAKLLRVIQDGVVRRVGSERTDAVVNVRFIAATNNDPEEAVKTGKLREDLYYRLRVVPIHVPPLRERPEDIAVLANQFLTYYWNQHRDKKLPLPTLTKEAVWALRAHSWPGNVRELQNVMEHAVVLLEPGADVQAADIPFICDQRVNPDALLAEDSHAVEESYYEARERLLSKFDRRYLTRVVLRAGGNLSKAARLARVDRTTFYRLMERHGLHRNLLAGDTE